MLLTCKIQLQKLVFIFFHNIYFIDIDLLLRTVVEMQHFFIPYFYSDNQFFILDFAN